MDFIKTMLPFIAIAIGVFLVLREFFCWYWKMNKIVELLEEQNRKLETQNRNILKLVKSQNSQKNISKNNKSKKKEPINQDDLDNNDTDKITI
jgi:hypothetical protein